MLEAGVAVTIRLFVTPQRLTELVYACRNKLQFNKP